MADEGIFDTVYCCHGDCPVGVDTIDELIAALAGALDGSIKGVKPDRPFGGSMGAPLTYTCGASSIYMTL